MQLKKARRFRRAVFISTNGIFQFSDIGLHGGKYMV